MADGAATPSLTGSGPQCVGDGRWAADPTGVPRNFKVAESRDAPNGCWLCAEVTAFGEGPRRCPV